MVTSRLEKHCKSGIGDATVFVAVTDSDDRNLIACALAEDEYKRQNGVSIKQNLLSIGRFRNRNYVEEHQQGHLLVGLQSIMPSIQSMEPYRDWLLVFVHRH